MTEQDEIIDMAVKAGIARVVAEVNIDIIEAFAKLVEAKAATKEREAILQNKIQAHEVGGFTDVVTCFAIRARGEA